MKLMTLKINLKISMIDFTHEKNKTNNTKLLRSVFSKFKIKLINFKNSIF